MLSRKILAVVLLLSSFHFSCRKKITPTFYKGKVENRLTHQPLNGIQIQVIEKIWKSTGLMSSTYLYVIKDQITSNEKGEFTFRIDTIKQNNTYILKSVNSIDTDSLKTTNQFWSEEQRFDVSKTKDQKLISISPLGFVRIYIDDMTWKTTSADTIQVECLYEGKRPSYFVRNMVNQLAIGDLEASKSIQFRFYPIIKGVKVKALSQEIFALNSIYYNTTQSRKLNLNFN